MKISKTNVLAFTLIEMMISSVILIGLLSLSIRYFRVSNARSNLTVSANVLLDKLQYAQTLATTRNKIIGLCFKEDALSDYYYIRIYEPELNASTLLPSDDDCDSDDTLIEEYILIDGIEICTNCDSDIALNNSVFFTSKGRSILQNGNEKNYEICIIQSMIDSGNLRTKEIEIGSGGIIEIVPQGDEGDYSVVEAHSGNCL